MPNPKLAVFKSEYEAARKQLNETAGKAFKEFASDIFDAHPSLENFGWTQYTPYFNDGDECEFGVSNDSDSVYVNGETIHGYADGTHSCACGYQFGRATKFCRSCGTAKPEPVHALSVKSRSEVATAVAEMLTSVDDEMLKDIYGDHVTVTIYRNGEAKTEQYEHE